MAKVEPRVKVRHSTGAFRTGPLEAVIAALTNALSATRIVIAVPGKYLDSDIVPHVLGKVPKIIKLPTGDESCDMRLEFGLAFPSEFDVWRIV